MYIVINKSRDERKYFDRSKCRDIIVGPGQSVLTPRPPLASDIWEVKLQSEKVEQADENTTSKNNVSRGNKNMKQIKNKRGD
jgi:hypothetical protein